MFSSLVVEVFALLLLVNSASAAAHLLENLNDVVATVQNVEKDGHRIMVQIDSVGSSEPFAAIAAHYSNGWSFTKVKPEHVDAREVMFVHTDNQETVAESDLFFLSEDFYKFVRTSAPHKCTKPGQDNLDPFHLVGENSKRFYLAAFKNGNTQADPKYVGVFVTDNNVALSNSMTGKFFYYEEATGEKKSLKVPRNLAIDNLEVFCRTRHDTQAGWKTK